MPRSEVHDIVEWMKGFYSGEGRNLSPQREQSDQDYAFFDERFRHLAARWYRTKFGRPQQEPQKRTQ